MTDSRTLVDVTPATEPSGEEPENTSPELTAAEQDAVRELVRQARACGTALTGPGGTGGWAHDSFTIRDDEDWEELNRACPQTPSNEVLWPDG